MPLTFSPRRRAAALLVAVAAACAAGSVHADSPPPTPPDGWTAQASGDVEIYRVERNGLRFEMRLSAVEPAPADFDGWFAARVAQPVQGVLAQRFMIAPPKSPVMRSALARGQDGSGAGLTLMRAGCKRDDGHVVFVELVSPNDAAFGRAATGEGLTVFGKACSGTATWVASDIAAPAAVATAPAPGNAKPAPPPPPPEYAYMTKVPGTGLKSPQFERVMQFWRNEQAGMTMQVHTYFFILLKDGTFHDGMPGVWFQDFDVDASRKGEPGNWGHWTHAGKLYHFTWPNGYKVDLDESSLRQPARPSEMLAGVWKGYSAYSTPFSVSQSHWAVEFTKGGRFLKTSGNEVTGSLGIGGGGGAPVGGAVISDDNGTTSTMGGANFATMRARRAANPRGNREGSYKLDGYNLELDYDNGVVERRPFVATADRKRIYFEGDELDSTLR